jgi:hypothetical protein
MKILPYTISLADYLKEKDRALERFDICEVSTER